MLRFSSRVSPPGCRPDWAAKTFLLQGELPPPSWGGLGMGDPWAMPWWFIQVDLSSGWKSSNLSTYNSLELHETYLEVGRMETLSLIPSHEKNMVMIKLKETDAFKQPKWATINDLLPINHQSLNGTPVPCNACAQIRAFGWSKLGYFKN